MFWEGTQKKKRKITLAETLPQEECGLIEYTSSGVWQRERQAPLAVGKLVGLTVVGLWGSLYTTCEYHTSVLLLLQAHRADWICVAGWLVFCDNSGVEPSLRLVDSLAPLASNSCCSYSLEQRLDWVKMLAEKNCGSSKAGSQYWRLQRWHIRLFGKKQDLWL